MKTLTKQIQSELLSSDEYFDIAADLSGGLMGSFDAVDVRRVDYLISALDAHRLNKLTSKPVITILSHQQMMRDYEKVNYNMNKLKNDKGEWVTSCGAPGSIARLKCERPALIARALEAEKANASFISIIKMLHEAGISPGLELQNMLAILLESD